MMLVKRIVTCPINDMVGEVVEGPDGKERLHVRTNLFAVLGWFRDNEGTQWEVESPLHNGTAVYRRVEKE